MMSKPTFEFCALKFLIQWQRYESALHTAFSQAPTECDIDAALKFFRVARSFRSSDDRLVSILSSLNDARHNQSLSNPQEKVKYLTSIFSQKFGKKNISAASKLLWLSYRSPFIVYDGRAIKALNRFGHKFVSYAQYSIAWRQEYAEAEDSIWSAVGQLPSVKKFARYPISDAELVELANAQWFRERVFDMFLWETGGAD